MIRLENIQLKVPGFTIEDINLSIQKKDFFALMGPTGSGKSLLLEGIMGIMPFSDGHLFLKDKDITDAPVEKRQLAVVYQDFALFPHMNVTQNILYGIRYHHIPKQEAMQRMDFLVSKLGLEKIVTRRPSHLSGGEKQRVALVRSLVLNPEVLLMDEPLSALDPVFHEEAKLLLKKIHEDLDMTIIMVSHNFSDVMFLANQGAIMSGGRILQQGDMSSLFERPNTSFTARFVGMKNLNRIDVKGNVVHLPGKNIHIAVAAVPHHPVEYMGIRPEEIELSTSDDNTAQNLFQGRITSISSNGIYLNIGLDAQSMAFEAIWPGHYIKRHNLETGKVVSFSFPPHAVHLF